VRLSVPAGSNNWYQSSQVHPGVAAVAGGALVVAGGVMVFGGSSGGEVVGPCVGLCVVASGSRRCGSGSCVGLAGRAVLDGVCRRRGRAFVARPCVDSAQRHLCARGRVSSREGSCVGARRDGIVHRSRGSTPAAAVWLGGMEKVAVVAATTLRSLLH
jgi:hypothetical protein